MKIKLKTLKGDAFECEVTPDMPIGKVKELAAASDHGTKGGWEVEGVKLIFQGKVLDNDKDLASCECRLPNATAQHATHRRQPLMRATVPPPPAAQTISTRETSWS